MLHRIAMTLKRRISHDALSRKELKSLARSIGYPIGFFNSTNRMLLKKELVFVYAFLGSVALRVSFSQHPQVQQPDVDEAIEAYRLRLIDEEDPTTPEVSLVCGSWFNDYRDRLDSWEGLLEHPDDVDQSQKDYSKLATTFYQFLTKTPCDAQKEWMLTLRFSAYVRLFLDGIDSMIQEFDL